VRALIMPVGADWYAISIESILEVVVCPAVVPVPSSHPALVGLFNLRGDIVALFDIAALLGTGRAREGTHIVVVRNTLATLGLLAGGAPETTDLEEPVGEARSAAALGLYAVGTRLVALVSVDDLVIPDSRDLRVAGPTGASR
jgi:chemotaxis signal transduction protein